MALNIAYLKIWAETIQSFATTIAIVVGGWWTYSRFVRNRLSFPRADVEHEITNAELIPGKRLLRVTLTVTNKGDVLIPISKVWTRVSQILPLPIEQLNRLTAGKPPEMEDATEILWPELGCLQLDYPDKSAEIEPGESESFPFDFILDSAVKKVRVYSFFQNNRKTETGWASTNIIDL